MDVNHGQLDQVRRRTLDDRVDRCAFRKVSLARRAAPNAADGAAPAEDGTNIAACAGILPVSRARNSSTPRIAIEIGVDECRRFVLVDVQLLRQAERALPVNHAKIHRLGAAPHLRGHLRPAARRTPALATRA